MGLPDNVVRANIRAVVGGTEEIVHTLHFQRVNTTVPNPPSLQEIAEKIVTEWTSVIQDAQGTGSTIAVRLRNDMQYVSVNTYSLGPSGLATGQAEALFGPGVGGSSAADPLPPDVAVVASLRTGLPGRSKRGRLYLGGFVSPALAPGGRLELNLRNTIGQALATFGNDMKMAPTAGNDRLNWTVLSRTTTSTQKITLVRVGDIFDTQRRRDNKLSEAYSQNTITY